MAKSPQEIVDLLVGYKASSATGSRDDILKDALQTLETLWSSHQQADVEEIARKIADAARDDKWRIPIGESGILDFFLEKVQEQGTKDPVVQTLRVIGNGCVDCDENRDRVVASKKLPYLVGLLKEDNLVKFVVPTIFNICVSCISAQNQAYEAGFSTNIIDIIDSPRLKPVRGILGLMLKGLELLEASKNNIEPKFAQSGAATRLLNFLVTHKSTLDLEEFTYACTVTLAYLSYERFQTDLLRADKLPLLLDLFSYTLSLPPKPEEQADEELDEEEIEIRDQRIANSRAFVDIISKISEHPEAFTRCGPGTRVFDSLIDEFLPSSSQPQQQIVACLFLGNLACSDDSSVAVGSETRVRDTLVSIVSGGVSLLGISSTVKQPTLPGIPRVTSEPLQVVHQAISCLKNLSIPPGNKPLLGSTGELLESVLPQYWTAPSALDQGILIVVVSLTRLLVTNCSENVKKLVTPGEDGETKLHILIEVLGTVESSGKDKSSPEVVRIKTDIYRTVCAVCKALLCAPLPSSSSSSSENETEGGEKWAPTLKERVKFLEDHPDVMPVLGRMLEECKNLGIRAEVLFVLAKMAGMGTGPGEEETEDNAADMRFIASVPLKALDSSPKNLAALADSILGEGAGARLLASIDGSGTAEDQAGPPSEEAANGTGAASSSEDASLANTLSNLTLAGDDAGTGTGTTISSFQPQPQPQPPLPDANQDRRVMIVRENGLTLASHILHRCADRLDDTKKRFYEQLVKQGWEKVHES